VIWTS